MGRYKLNMIECINLIYKDVLDGENPENFTDEFNKNLVDVIWAIREIVE